MTAEVGRRRAPGLRTRLVVVFALVTALGAGLAVWSSVGTASAALAASARDQQVDVLAGRLAAVAPSTAYPPAQEDLDRLRDALGVPVVVRYGGLVSGATTDRSTDALRAAVRDGDRMVSERVVVDGRPWLLVGTPVALTAPDGSRTPSGLEVYLAHDLGAVQAQVDALVRRAAWTSVLAVLVAVVVALVAARGVLRPVRDLRDTARRLADGDLAARTTPRGSDELADLARTVDAMAASVQAHVATEERMRAEARRFAADVSHELRTPLSALTAVLEVLDDAVQDLDDDARESARLATDGTRRLVRLVDDLMEISRFDSGTAALRAEPTDVPAVVRSAVAVRGWSGRVEVDGAGGAEAVVDPRRLDAVVANLVGNALRHGAPPVRVRVRGETGHVVVEVSDHGPGIPEQVLPLVFDRFVKGDAARSSSPGSGLGLAIAAENARLHGATLTADNDGPDGGARFVLRLPVAGTAS